MSSQPSQPGPGSAGDTTTVADASRRTRLANERTYLAWWRTGIGCVAVGLASGKLLPATHEASWPYTVVGVGFTFIGIVFIAMSVLRHREVDAAISRGEFAPPSDRIITAIAAAGVLLALFVVVIILVNA